MRFCVFDVSNLIYRVAMAETQRSRASPRDAVGLALATAIRSMRMPFSMFDSKHVVACFDHYSWRRDVYPDYKANRRAQPGDVVDPASAELKTTIGDAIESLRNFLSDGTNVSVLCEPGFEADDFVARFTAMHVALNDTSVIVSTDSDFKQLVSEHVWLYNPTVGTLYRPDGAYAIPESKRQAASGVKGVHIGTTLWLAKLDKEGKAETIDPKWELFEKIMRGDKTDNVPGAAVPRTRSTVLQMAYSNPTGPAMQDLMAARRKDLPGNPTVKEVYEKTKVLIDLTAQPTHIRDAADFIVADRVGKAPRKNVLIAFAEFCREWGMVNLLNEAERYAPMLAARYQ